jgi:hypothetical protein
MVSPRCKVISTARPGDPAPVLLRQVRPSGPLLLPPQAE